MVTTTEHVLIVNADDFGLAECVNTGIREAHEAGVVTSASLLATGEAFDHAVAIACTHRSLGIGVHLDFVEGRPLTSARTLIDAHTVRFHTLPHLAWRTLLGRIDPVDVRNEALAQIDRVRQTGLQITHVDGHRHAHLLPGIWSPVIDAARQRGIGVVRIPIERLSSSSGLSATLKGLALRAAARVATKSRSGLRTVDNFVGVSLQGRHHFGALLVEIIDALPPGVTELMVHPGHAPATLSALDSYRDQREVELRGLLSALVRDRLHQRDIRLTHFGAIA